MWRPAVFGTVVLVLAASPASALDLGQWVSGLKLSPFLSETMEYETNVFQAPSRAQDDFISRTVPGVLADWTIGPVSLSAGYRAEILRFLHLGSQDTLHHIAVGQLKLDWNRLLVNVRDDYTFTSDPPGSELTGRVKSTTNVVNPEAEFKLTDRFSLGGNYSWTHVDFETVNQLDRDEHFGGTSVFWKFLPKTDLRLNYNYGRKGFESASERDVTRNVILVGIRGELTAKLSSTFRMGYESRETSRTDLKEYHGPVAGGDWTYRPTERTTLMLLTNRAVEESTFGATLFFVSTTATLSAEHKFLPKLSANARLSLGKNDYPTKDTVSEQTKFRSDTLFSWGAGLEYDVQPWLRLSADYSHSRRDSNFDTSSSKDDKISGKVTLQF